MAPEVEAATALLEVWEGELEELSWAAELLETIGKQSDPLDPGEARRLTELARQVCGAARSAGSKLDTIERLERASAALSARVS